MSSLGDCDLVRIISFLSNINIQNETMLGIKNFYDELTLSLKTFIKEASTPVLTDFTKVDPRTTLFDHLVPTPPRPQHTNAYHTYIMRSKVLSTTIPN